VEEAKHFGASLSEMPTTIEAARKAKELGMFVCMGAPNYYRGGSHCGNLSCVDAINENLVDIFCSDYHFPTLIGSLVKMLNEGVNPSYAVNLMTKNPADYLQMHNLGSIEEGKTADLVSFGIKNNYGAISNVMVNGNLVQRSRYSEKEIAEPVGIIY
jgi:alpha-D-ribose 1-methylphosphonate 5-triphosphate diphosphatase